MRPLSSKTRLLEIVMWLGQTLRQGEIRLHTDGTENVKLQIESNKINLDFLQGNLLKDMLDLGAEMEEESILKRLKTLKDLAEKLKEKGLTMTISHKEHTVLTLGKEAHPKTSQVITRTNAIEVNNLVGLVKLVK